MPYDAIIVGGGHNGLCAAAYLAQAGKRVLVLERLDHVGGAAVSERPFNGIDARLSRYSYLVSLLPPRIIHELGLELEIRGRAVSSYTPVGDKGLWVGNHNAYRTEQSFLDLTGDPGAYERWRQWDSRMLDLQLSVGQTLLDPLISRADMRARLHPADWDALVERPIADALFDAFPESDPLRGILLTDALIGTFARSDEASLKQNRCFLYHMIGGAWNVPVGGMGQVTAALEQAARAAGAEIRTNAEVESIDPDGAVRLADGTALQATDILCNAAPQTLDRLLGIRTDPGLAPEGSQLKINMLLARLPALRDPNIAPADAFAGTLHVHEGHDELDAAFDLASDRRIPDLLPCEVYCHSLTDQSILAPDLRTEGVHTLTLFGLHAPARLFDSVNAKHQVTQAALRALNDVLAEPLEDCLLYDADGRPCLEAKTPLDLEHDLGLPAGHIFHRDLAWPWAEHDEHVGSWGVETEHPHVWLCGAGAVRGGGVSGIPGRNAAYAILGR